MAKKEKAKKPEEPEAEKPAAEGEEGAPAKKKMSGKTLILFIVLPALLVIGGGGAAAVMLLGGHPAAAAEHEGAEGEKKAEKKKPEKKDEHGGGEHGGEKKEGAAPAAGADGDVGHALDCEGDGPCYYQMPKLVVNLSGAEGERTPYMELELVLEAASTDTFETVPNDMPRLKDQLNAYLRELRVEDLNGSGGDFRLRRELLKRFNTVIAPAKVDAVLIQGMLIQ